MEEKRLSIREGLEGLVECELVGQVRVSKAEDTTLCSSTLQNAALK
jgi:hypothetical protein